MGWRSLRAALAEADVAPVHAPHAPVRAVQQQGQGGEDLFGLVGQDQVARRRFPPGAPPSAPTAPGDAVVASKQADAASIRAGLVDGCLRWRGYTVRLYRKKGLWRERVRVLPSKGSGIQL